MEDIQMLWRLVDEVAVATPRVPSGYGFGGLELIAE